MYRTTYYADQVAWATFGDTTPPVIVAVVEIKQVLLVRADQVPEGLQSYDPPGAP